MSPARSAFHDAEVVDLLAEQPALLAIADAVVATQESKRPRAVGPRRALAIAAVMLVLAVAAALVELRGGGRSLVAEALAAVGTGPVVHAVIAADDPRGSVIDVDSGRETPVRVEIEYWFDEERRVLRTVVRRNGVVASEFRETRAGSESSEGPVRTLPGYEPALDPALAGFASGYRTALADGSARAVGEGELDGRAVRWLEFRARGVRERVAVDVETHRPLAIEPATPSGDAPPFRWRVDVLESVPRRSASLGPLVPRAPAPVRGDVRASVPLSAMQAAATLVWPALWLGERFDDLTLTTIERQELSRGYAPGVAGVSRRGEGLRLVYRGGGRFVEIQQAPRAEPAYAFGGGRSTFSFNPVPADGFAELTQLGGAGGADDDSWLAQLRRGGVFLSIWGSSRADVLAAARALRPIETGGRG